MQDVVMSSRVRIARNFKNLAFTNNANYDSSRQVLDLVKQAIGEDYDFVELSSLAELDREYLEEINFISKELRAKRIPTALVSKKNDDSLAVMVNEEDHLRIQTIMPGLALFEAYTLAKEFEEIKGFQKEYAFDKEFGYLTCCPTNVGTGLRASAMVHLAAIEKTSQIPSLIEEARKMGIAVRGIHGENTKSVASLYQLSNQVTLGFNDQEIIGSVTDLIKKIIEIERNTRESLHKQLGLEYDDMIYRAYGLLTNARLLSTNEALSLLSDFKLGVDRGLFEGIKPEDVIALMSNVQPASLQKINKKVLSAKERDFARAELIRDKLRRLRI